jgi:LmbE family N-acetylglucosaminyl deacetylase
MGQAVLNFQAFGGAGHGLPGEHSRGGWRVSKLELPENPVGIRGSDLGSRQNSGFPCSAGRRGASGQKGSSSRNGLSRVLAISAHPDDLDFGCAGTLALWARSGAELWYLICTSGDKGSDDPRLPRRQIALTRQEEQRAAARLVGVREVVFLGFPDGELQNDDKLRKELVRWIRRIRPDVVLCQDPGNRSFENPYVSHRDHRMAAEAAFDALYPACGNPHFFPELLEQGLGPHKVREVLFFGTHSPNFWQDITQVMDLKIQAVLCHRSQVADPGLMEQFLRRRFAEVGKQAGCPYAEPFRRLLLQG